MSWRLRKSKTIGGVRLTAGKRSLSGSIGTRHVRATRSRRGTSASATILPGLSWLWRRRKETDE